MKDIEKLVLLNLINRNGNLDAINFNNGYPISRVNIFEKINILKEEDLITVEDESYSLTLKGIKVYNQLCKASGFKKVYKSILPLPKNWCAKINSNDIVIPKKRRK